MFKPQRKPNRWNKWNYSDFGFYFITICTKGREEHFGTVKDGMMGLSEIGEIVCRHLQRIPDYYEKVFIDEFVVMPNHIHAIILNMREKNNSINLVGTGQCPVPTRVGTGQCPVPTRERYGLVSKIVNSYKNIVTKTIRNKYNVNFSWQRSFYDHVIHTNGELERIRKYIRDNPYNWISDKNNPTNYAKNIKNKSYSAFK